MTWQDSVTDGGSAPLSDLQQLQIWKIQDQTKNITYQICNVQVQTKNITYQLSNNQVQTKNITQQICNIQVQTRERVSFYWQWIKRFQFYILFQYASWKFSQGRTPRWKWENSRSPSSGHFSDIDSKFCLVQRQSVEKEYFLVNLRSVHSCWILDGKVCLKTISTIWFH